MRVAEAIEGEGIVSFQAISIPRLRFAVLTPAVVGPHWYRSHWSPPTRRAYPSETYCAPSTGAGKPQKREPIGDTGRVPALRTPKARISGFQSSAAFAVLLTTGGAVPFACLLVLMSESSTAPANMAVRYRESECIGIGIAIAIAIAIACLEEVECFRSL